MTIDGSQQVGVGVTPATWTTYKSVSIAGTGQSIAASSAGEMNLLANTYYNSGWKYAATQGAARFSIGENYNDFRWYTAPSGTAGNAITFTQAMTLDASGNLLVGTTTSPGVSGVGIGFLPGFSTSGVSMVCRTGTAANNDNVYFYTSSGLAGYIRTNGTTTTYASVSDERLKENIADANSAVEKIQQIQVRKFDWKSGDGHVDYGFIAQELKVVAPQAVAEGTKENDVWAVDTSMLVPLLTKAIQEQQALITQLQADVAALKGA
jgi:hypothetical protein